MTANELITELLNVRVDASSAKVIVESNSEQFEIGGVTKDSPDTVIIHVNLLE